MISARAANNRECRVGIVGGGILGMTLALRLQGDGCAVTIIEGGSAPGGLTQSQTIGGYTWDRFYHVILQSDRNLLALLNELDLIQALRWGTTRTGFYTDGRLHSLSNSLEFLRFPALSLFDKVRLAATVLYAARVQDWRPLERIRADEWLRRLSGDRTFERIWLPLLKSKLGQNYERTSASFIWATIARMYAARRSGLKREMFGYVEGGYDRVLREFRGRLEAQGVGMLCGRAAVSINDDGDAVQVRLADGEVRTFDRVVLTVPCPRIHALCSQLSPEERSRLGNVVYQGIICASVLLRKPLAGFYITNITDSWVPFTAVIEMTSLVDREQFGGNALVYLPRYLVQDDPVWSETEDSIQERFLSALERMYPGFQRTDVLTFQVARAKEMLALTTLNYSEEALPRLRTSLPNVFIVNSAQIVNGTLNVNETIGLADASARELRPLLSSPAVGVAA